MDPDVQLKRRRQLWKSALAVTTVSAQYLTLLMALSLNSSEKAHWTDREVDALVDYLYEHRSQAGDGGSFKDPTFNGALAHIAPLLSQGPVKTGKMCKTKWSALTTIYTCIETYRNQSEFHWDGEHGASIEGDAAAAVWTNYIQQKSNSSMRPFRNRGWQHYEKLRAILPNTCARGSHAFRATNAASSMSTQDETTSVGTSEHLSSSNISGLAITSSFTSSDPAKKKQLKSTSKYSAAASTSSARIAAKITLAVAISGMQGSINRLTDVFEKSMVTPDGGTVTRRTRAMQLIQERDDGLAIDDKVAMISLFMTDAVMADTYLSLTDVNVRQGWMQKMLASQSGEAVM